MMWFPPSEPYKLMLEDGNEVIVFRVSNGVSL